MYEALKNFNRDYAIEVYFKENGTVGHKSRYTMGELAHHLMVEGQFSLSANMRGRPHKQMRVVGKGANGKYLLEHDAGYKKIWNFMENAAKRHKNWRAEIFSLAEKLLIRKLSLGLLGRSMNGVNFYTEMQRLAKKVKEDVKQELLALREPKLATSTAKKKRSEQILIETRKLFNAISVRVVPLKRNKSNRLNFGRAFAGSNQKLTAEEAALVRGYLGAGANAEGFLAAYRANHSEEESSSVETVPFEENFDDGEEEDQ